MIYNSLILLIKIENIFIEVHN